MENPVLQCSCVSRLFQNDDILKQVTFSLEQGHVAGLFGPNGSGKSTLLKIAAGRLVPDSGKITICGRPSGRASRAAISYLPEFCTAGKRVRISGLIRQYAAFFPDFDPLKANALIAFFQLPQDARIKELAAAQLQMLSLLLTLARAVPLYLLDEPLFALNVDNRKLLLQRALAVRPADSAVVIASHLVKDIEDIVDDALFLRGGRLSWSGSAAQLRQEQNKSLYTLYREGFGWQ